MSVGRVLLLALRARRAVCAGCTSVRVNPHFGDVKAEGGRAAAAIVEIENSGWYLFTCIPLASGDFEHPNDFGCRWFRDTVHLQNNLAVLNGEMRRAGVSEVANLTSHRSDEKYLVFLLARRAYHTSAVLLKPEE